MCLITTYRQNCSPSVEPVVSAPSRLRGNPMSLTDGQSHQS